MPRQKEPLTARIEIRCSEELKEKLSHVAELQGRSLSDLIVEAASEKATQLIAEHQIINLTISESRAFARALCNPPQPNKYLLESGQIFKKLNSK